MDWIKNLNRAVDYIESNIAEKLDYDLIAKEAHSSKFHFQRVFSILTGKSLGEYIKERRLSLAAVDIKNNKEKVIDIALKYGYQDPGAFTKAFKRFHGVTPTQGLKAGIIFKDVPPLSFSINVKSEKKFNYRIEKKELFKIIGTSTEIGLGGSTNYKTAPEFWHEKSKDGTIYEVTMKSGSMGIIGACYNFDMEAGKLNYMVAVEGDETSAKLSELLEIPSLTWAIFPGKGVGKDYKLVWDYVFNEWFPTTNYNLADAPELEVYLKYDYRTHETEFEIWIPIEEKESR